MLRLLRSRYSLLLDFPPPYRSGDSKGESCFRVKPHFHPGTTEHFLVLEGEVHFELDGKKYIAGKSEKPFVIPKGAVHGVTFPQGKPTKFLLRAGSDSELVAGRDFLMEFLSLIAEVSVHGSRF